MLTGSDLSSLAARFKGDISEPSLRTWLSQFDNRDLEYIVPLVANFRYYSHNDVFAQLDVLFGKLTSEHKIDPRKTWFIPSGYVAKSGDAVAYFFKRRNHLPDDAFLRAADLDERRIAEKQTVVFLDDLLAQVSYYYELTQILCRLSK